MNSIPSYQGSTPSLVVALILEIAFAVFFICVIFLRRSVDTKKAKEAGYTIKGYFPKQEYLTTKGKFLYKTAIATFIISAISVALLEFIGWPR